MCQRCVCESGPEKSVRRISTGRTRTGLNFTVIGPRLIFRRSLAKNRMRSADLIRWIFAGYPRDGFIISQPCFKWKLDRNDFFRGCHRAVKVMKIMRPWDMVTFPVFIPSVFNFYCKFLYAVNAVLQAKMFKFLF